MKKVTAASFFFFLSVTSFSNADSVDDAYTVCKVLDNSVPMSKPCEVSGWNTSVDVSIDTNSSEAIKICDGVADLAKKNGMSFGKGWKIRIYSPFSNGNTIAVCGLE